MKLTKSKAANSSLLHDRFVADADPGAELDQVAQSRELGSITLLAVAGTVGLATGLVEVLILAVQHAVSATSMLGGLQMNRHFQWMIPVSHLALFILAVLPVLVINRIKPSLGRRLLTMFVIFLPALSLLLLIKALHIGASVLLAAGIARLGSGWIPERTAIWNAVRRIGLPISLAIVILIGAFSFQRLVLAERMAIASLPAVATGKPNVLLIVMDTVRADRLSLAGYRRKTTPHLDRLAQRGVVFEQARSTAPWTLPSHASMFTGRLPHELKMTASRPLDTTYPTLAEHLATNGYATAGFVGNTYFCNSWYGLARGFAHYEDYYEDNVIISPYEALRCSALGRLLISAIGGSHNARPGTINALKDAPRVNQDFLGWLDEQPHRPFFAFLNYIDAHDPYELRGLERGRFGLAPETPADMALIQNWHQHDKKSVSERDLTLLSDSYDDCLALLDHHLGRLFDDLEKRGILKDTLVIVTSDHGEAFGEHGLYLHGQSLYSPETRVPLIMVGPEGLPAGSRVSEPVSLKNLASTIVEQVGLSAQSPFPGRSLSSYWNQRPDEVKKVDAVISEVSVKEKPSRHPHAIPAMRGPMVSILKDWMLLIRDGQGTEELFDLRTDPTETKNLIKSPAHQPILESLRQQLSNEAVSTRPL